VSGFQWWTLIVGLALGGGGVWLLTTSFARRDVDLEPDEREAEATFIASHLAPGGRPIDRATVAEILAAHREYLGLPAPIAIVAPEGSADEALTRDRDPDGEADDVGDGRSRPTDRDLAEP
jgi:hypothetical protein